MKCYRGRLLRTPWPIPSHILITQAALCETFVEPGVGAFLGRSRVLSSHDHRFLGPFFRHTGSPERSIKLLKEPEGRVITVARHSPGEGGPQWRYSDMHKGRPGASTMTDASPTTAITSTGCPA
ncbi:hypothetical protein E2C01_008679 [Portunus trituberculatus]|uniref:Uncharacterized protein n=1 Tax=Portunus trituberculatus TaxID=210409 RepID=A0A5B7D3I3_PORTR|nr:hypothetical protein [Portunus trituberculatus]